MTRSEGALHPGFLDESYEELRSFKHVFHVFHGDTEDEFWQSDQPKRASDIDEISPHLGIPPVQIEVVVGTVHSRNFFFGYLSHDNHSLSFWL